MAYEKTDWVPGENKFDITTQDGTVIEEDIKLVYKGTTGTPVSDTNMNKIETGIEGAEELTNQVANKVNMNYEVFTSSGTFTVPEGVTEVKISGCAAGGTAGGYGQPTGKAGQYLLDVLYTVTPGQTLTVVCGTGNTTISELSISLLANTLTSSTPTLKLGVLTGLDGTKDASQSWSGLAGIGGAFGFGGGGGNNNGEGIAGDGGGPLSTGAKGGTNASRAGKDGQAVQSIYKGLIIVTGAGAGFGASSGISGTGGKTVGTSTVLGGNAATNAGGGGAAGGYGAGGGQGGLANGGGPGHGSPGFILIEW